MILNERELKILEKFYHYKILPLSSLSAEFEISERMVRYNIDRINTVLNFVKIDPIKKHSKGHFILENNRSNKLLEVLKELKPLDKIKRLYFIQFIIAFSKIPPTITYLANYFQVSRITINTDLKEINKEISKFCVKISNINGLKIGGNLNDISKYSLWILNENIEYFYKEEISSFSLKIKEIIYEKTNEEIIKNIFNISNEVILENKLELDFVNYKFFISKMIYIFLNDTNEENTNILKYKEYEYIKEKLKKYKILDKIPEYKINEISKIVFWIKSYKNYEEYYKDNINIEVLVKNIINNIENQINIKISEDKLLFEFLIQHIKALIFKIDKGYELKDLLIEEKKEDELYFIIKDAMKVMTNIIGKNINDDQIHLLKIHFLASIERILKQESKPTQVIVITSLGPGSSKILLDNIKSKFLIDVVFIGPLYKLDITLKENPNIKYILSTIDIDEILYLDKKIIKINPILTKEDKNKLSDLGFKSNNNKINLSDLITIIEKNTNLVSKDKLIDDLMDKFSDKIINNINKNNDSENILQTKNILFDYKEKDLAKAIEKSCSLLENEYIDKSYTKDLLAIYNQNTNYIIRYNGVILAHTRNKNNVYKNGVSIITLDKPLIIKDSNETIDTIVTFVIKDEKNISNSISNIINKVFKEDFKKLLKSKDKIKLIKFLID